jgi:hypothetical protein
LSALKRLAIEQHFVCGPVRYLGASYFNEWLVQQLSALKEGLEEAAVNEKDIREQASGDPQEQVDMWVLFQRSGNLERWIGEVAALLKNADFRSEAEWRCVFLHRENTIQRQKPMHFRNSGSKVVRFVELDISHADLNELIAEVIIGPGGSGYETSCAVTDLLRNAGVNATILFPRHAVR